MRLPNSGENLVGKVAVNSTGRVGIITGRKRFTFSATEAWVGIGFDGKGTWCSTAPCIVAEDAEEFRQRLSDRFNGRMSFLG